ncbi:hypothetical protein SK128_019151 [Halocaridina rubra]|uniref:Ion transport domain-containing protein n=1 Tax=Halocaridina rubra TaxID=373956 RepID=A0AAN9A8H6_HALRR
MKMLGRKQSLRGEPILADYGPEETLNESSEIEWVNKTWVRWILQVCSLVSLVSVSANTPRSKELFPSLRYMTFCSDLIITFLFTAEMIAKMQARGILKGEVPYLKDRWCQYDASMVFFLWMSIILQIFEEMTDLVNKHSYLSVLRAPRPLIVTLQPTDLQRDSVLPLLHVFVWTARRPALWRATKSLCQERH